MLNRLAAFLGRYQLWIIVAMLGLGMTFPSFFKPLNPLNSTFLQIIIFGTGLRLDFKEVLHQIKDWRTLVFANGMMMIGIPVLVSIPLAWFAPDWSLPFIIAASLPTGLTAPVIVGFLGGRTSLALLMSVSTYVIAPVTIPLVLKLLVGRSVHVDVLSMMLEIASVVIVPLALAWFIQSKAGKKRIQKHDSAITVANVSAFGLVVASIASASLTEGGGRAAYGITLDGVLIAAVMMFLWFGLAWFSASVLTWRSKKDRLTIAFCLTYMSYALGIWIADEFFRETQIAPRLVAIVILVFALFPVFKMLFPEHKKCLDKVCMIDKA
jgi:predicted Na+-dependent transporter